MTATVSDKHSENVYKAPMMQADQLPSYRRVFLIYLLLFAVLTFRYWAFGEVIAPHRQAQELGMPGIEIPQQPENRKFSDYSNAYIPEIQQLLHGRRSGWLALWSDANELGRPLSHLGFSAAYPPISLLSLLTTDPQRFITVLSLSTCLLGGIFVMLLCRQLGLAPIAGLIAGGSLAASPYFMYWLTFPMFNAAATWSAAILYAITRLSRQQDFAGWAILSFSVYALLMTAYPQQVVVHAYILAAYSIMLASRLWRERSGAVATRYLGTLTIACIVAGLLCLPVYIDVYRIAQESTRSAANLSFFAQYLPHLKGLTDFARYLTMSLHPEIVGNPITPNYALPYDGLSVTPVVVYFAICALALALRRTWGWWLAIALASVLTFSPAAYAFAVKYLGFNLSPGIPLGNILLPVAIVVAYGVDRMHGEARRPKSWKLAAATASACVIGSLAGALIFAWENGASIDWLTTAMALGAILLLTVQLVWPSPLLPGAALVISVAYSGYSLMLHQAPSQIVVSSPLTSIVRANLAPDSRYAVLKPGLYYLQPNLNASLELNSIHSYNSLSSFRYRELLNALGSGSSAFGRWNDAIEPDFNSIAFWMSNISVVLTPDSLPNSPALTYIDQYAGARVYRVNSRMGCCLQVETPPTSDATETTPIADAALRNGRRAEKTTDQGDLVEFALADRAASVLVLSQKFHADWHAQALTGQGWSDVRTTAVNGIFQGAVLPEGATHVRMRFRPYARFAWIAHAFWLLVLALLAVQYAVRRNAARPVRLQPRVPQSQSPAARQ